jgi:anti-sigma B factor antagonist
MEVLKKVHDDLVEVELFGKLSYNDKNKFEDVVFAFSRKGTKKMVIDMEKLEYMDSNGIGMFLVLQEDAAKSKGELILKNLRGEVKRLFELSRMKEMFTFE